MTEAKKAIEIGMEIAERHRKNVLQLLNEFSATPEKALDGCMVSLAGDIMVAIHDAEVSVRTGTVVRRRL